MSTYVLVVDDNADTRELIVRSLKKVGLECICAEDGQQALDLVKEKIPGLIISDLMMPKLNGFSMLSTLQRDPSTARIPVFLLSGVAIPKTVDLPGVKKVILKGSLDLAGLRQDALQAMGLAAVTSPAA